MKPLLSSQQMRQADRLTIENKGISALALMENAAARAIVDALKNKYADTLNEAPGLILAGHGNNGGDALAVARLLFEAGHKNLSVFLAKKDGLSPETTHQLERFEGLGGKVSHTLDTSQCNWILDGLLGNGLKGSVREPYNDVITAVNKLEAWTLSIDIPSGLCADTGQALGTAICADHTLTLGFHKKGLFTGKSQDYVGTLSLDPIGIDQDISSLGIDAYLFETSDARSTLPKRKASGHKGQHGHVYIWAGTTEKEGACGLAALSALRAGAGFSTVIGDGDFSSLRQRLPLDIMVSSCSNDFFSTNDQVSLVMGPGMGLETPHWKRLEQALHSKHKLVLDADALTLIAQNSDTARSLLKARSKKTKTILTPHPGEAARLLKTDTKTIEADRYSAVTQIAREYCATTLLKGRGTLVCSPDGPTLVVNRGNSTLSKAGSGDILAGIVGTLIGQSPEKHDITKRVALGAYVHGRSAELQSQKHGTERASLASELPDNLIQVWEELES